MLSNKTSKYRQVMFITGFIWLIHWNPPL